MRLRKTANLVFLCLGLALSACASLPDYTKQVETLVGRSETELLACAGLPDGSLSLEDGRKAFLYSARRLSAEAGPFSRWGSWGHCPWGVQSVWCDQPFADPQIDIREQSCRLAVWLEDGKIAGVTGQYNAGGKVLCQKILQSCSASKAGDETSAGDPSPAGGDI